MEADDAYGNSVERVTVVAAPFRSSEKVDDEEELVEKAIGQRCGFSIITPDPRLSSPTSVTGSSLHSSDAAAFQASADTETPATATSAFASSRSIRCVPACDYHAHDVARLMEGFVNSEPLLTAASASDALLADANARQRLVAWTNLLIRRGLSVVALEDDAACEDGGGGGEDDGRKEGALVGALLTFVMYRDPEAAMLDDEAATALSVCMQHPANIAIEGAMARVEAEADVFGQLGADEVLAIGYATVSPQRRGGGILSRLLSAAEALASRRGLQAAVCAASSAFTQSALRRLGYEELASAEFAGLLDPTLFDLSKLGPHRRLAVLGKRLC